MSETVFERAAEAVNQVLCDAQGLGRDTLADIVRAVLEAIREPDAGMLVALTDTGKMWRQLSSKEVWQTYIDSILPKEG